MIRELYLSPYSQVFRIEIKQSILEGSPTHNNDDDDIIDNPGIGGPGVIPIE